MSNNVHINSQGIIEIYAVGNQDYTSVTSMGTQTKRLLEQLNKQGKPRLILDDITKLGTTDIAARQAVAQLAGDLLYDRAAMVGDGSVLMRVGTNLLLRAIGKSKRIKYFEDRQKAIDWLVA